MTSSAIKPALCRWSAYGAPGLPRQPRSAYALPHFDVILADDCGEGNYSASPSAVSPPSLDLSADGATMVARVKSRSVIAGLAPAGRLATLM